MNADDTARAMRAAGIDTHILDISRDEAMALDEVLVDGQGRVQVLPSAELSKLDPQVLRVWMHWHAVYLLPSQELVAWIQDQVGGRKAIEIGAGNGALGRALGIPMTDNRMQDRPEIRAQLAMMGGQPPVQYGDDVEKRNANAAVRLMKPDVVIGSWCTHLYKPEEHERKGNMYGIDELKIVAAADYIHVGSRKAHAKKRVLELPHEEYDLAGWIFSRGEPHERVVRIWRKP